MKPKPNPPAKTPVKRARGTNRRLSALRWTLQRAATEFGLDRTQLERRRSALGIQPGEDGCFTSQDIGRMMFGDKEAEALGKLAAERGKIERENREADGELVPLERVAILGERYVGNLRQIILNSGMSGPEKQECLSEIVALGEIDWQEEGKQSARKQK